MIKLAASNSARRSIGIQGRKSPIFVNFAPSDAQNQTNRPAREGRWLFQLVTPRHPVRWLFCLARWPRTGSAFVDIRPSPKTDVLVTKLIYWFKPHLRCIVMHYYYNVTRFMDIVCFAFFTVMFYFLTQQATANKNPITYSERTQVAQILYTQFCWLIADVSSSGCIRFHLKRSCNLFLF